MGNTALILLIVVILLGLAYSPMQNANLNQGVNPVNTSSSLGNTGENSSANSNTLTSDDVKRTEEQVKELERDVKKALEVRNRSPYYGKISMTSIAGLGQNNPDAEYMILYTNLDKNEKVNITGWYLKSEVTGYFAVIGQAALLPFPFTRVLSDVVLQDRDRVVLTKGFSPIGISFRTNKCTGFFEEDRTFYPNLPIDCPRPIDEKLPRFSNVYDRNDECLDLIERINRCTTKGSSFVRDLPDTVPSSCKTYITTQINYNTCVATHFSDIDFPGNEYRLFFNKFGPLWRERREKINLHDKSGLIVDTISN